MDVKRYSIKDINKTVNQTTKEITSKYWDKMDVRDIGVLNTFVWRLNENFRASLDDVVIELTEENEHIKDIITESYENERTAIGKSVLKQLIERLNL